MYALACALGGMDQGPILRRPMPAPYMPASKLHACSSCLCACVWLNQAHPQMPAFETWLHRCLLWATRPCWPSSCCWQHALRQRRSAQHMVLGTQEVVMPYHMAAMMLTPRTVHLCGGTESWMGRPGRCKRKPASEPRWGQNGGEADVCGMFR